MTIFRQSLYHNPDSFFKNADACHDATVEIIAELKPVFEIKHKIGAAKLTSEGEKSIPDLLKELNETLKPVEDKYEKEDKNCRLKDSDSSCIYAEQFRSFIKSFGPIATNPDKKHPEPSVKSIAPLKSGYIVTESDFENSNYEIMLDTGAQITIVSNKFYDSFNDNIESLSNVKTQYGKGTPMVFISNILFKFGSVSFAPTLAMVSKIVDFFEGSDAKHELIAILGADFLFNMPWEVNYDKSQIIFEQDVDKRLNEIKNWGQIPLEIIPGGVGSTSFELGINVLINSHPFLLLVDTGDSFTHLFEQCLPAPFEKQLKKSYIKLVSVERMMDQKEIDGVELIAGGQKVNLDIYVMPKRSVNAKGLSKLGFCGTLGASFLKNFNFIYDPETITIYLSPRKNKDEDFKNKWGIGTARALSDDDEAAFRINAVKPNSPADKEGLKKGDFITEIDGIKTSDISKLELNELLYYTNISTISLTVQHHNKTKKLKLKE